MSTGREVRKGKKDVRPKTKGWRRTSREYQCSLTCSGSYLITVGKSLGEEEDVNRGSLTMLVRDIVVDL